MDTKFQKLLKGLGLSFKDHRYLLLGTYLLLTGEGSKNTHPFLLFISSNAILKTQVTPNNMQIQRQKQTCEKPATRYKKNCTKNNDKSVSSTHKLYEMRRLRFNQS